MNDKNINGLNSAELPPSGTFDRRRFMNLSSAVVGASLLPSSLVFAGANPSPIGV